MTAGLLICDHVNRNHQAKFGDYPDMFAQIFPEFDWVLYDAINGQFPKDLNECELYMATGSRHFIAENLDWISRVMQIIQALHYQKKYFIGFCFGHQLIGEALGGTVSKSPHGWSVGVQEFEVYKEKAWMQPFQNSLNLLMMCQDQVIELPENATVIGGNSTCPHGIIQIGETILGIQAHPEYSKEYNQYLMEIRKDRIGEKTVENGINSLEKEVHQSLIRQWVLNFIKPKLSNQ